MVALELTDDDRRVFGRIQREPDWWCEQTLGDTLWSKQREILRSLAVNEKTAVASCHSVGKTFLAARAVLWFLHAYCPAIVATTAPTAHQVVNLLWREVRVAHGRLPADLAAASECLTTRLQFIDADKKAQPDHVAWGRSTKDANQFQGLHGMHLMAIVDEAAGVRDDIYEALDTWGAGGVYRELLIGNATSHEGKFRRAFDNPELGYNCIRIPVGETPNWTGEEVPKRVRRLLVQPDRVEAWRADWGENSPAFQARAYAQFPSVDAGEVIIPLAWLDVAEARAEDWKAGPDDTLQVGVDVARYGDDRTSVASRVGMALVRLESAEGDTSAPAVASMAASQAIDLRTRYHRPVLVVVDETGVGGGALDICQTRGDRDITYVGFQFGGRAIDAERRANAGAEAYWNLRDYAQPDNQFADLVVACPGSDEVCVRRFGAQVSARRYGYDAKGRVQIERKPAMKERGLPSPDESDAVVLAFASVAMEREEHVTAEDLYPEYQEFQLGAARL